MKYILTSILTFFLLSCASTDTRLQFPTDFKPATGSSVMILTRDGSMGHGCPIDDVIYTAYHLMKDDKAVTWSDNIGNGGTARVLAHDVARDLSVLTISSGRPGYLEFASSVTEDEEVSWYIYDFASRDKVFSRSIKEGKVVNASVAGYISFSGNLTSGASGGCLFNKQGEVVGIVVWGIGYRGKTYLNMAVSLVSEEDREVR